MLKISHLYMQAGKGEIIIYQENEGQLAIEVKLEDETLWLSQRQMGDLFEKMPTRLVHIFDLSMPKRNLMKARRQRRLPFRSRRASGPLTGI